MAEYSNLTGRTKKFALPSSIEEVMWSKNLASPGGLVELEVVTLYIGNNSEIQIDLSDASGKTLGKFTERMAGGYFTAPIRVPAEARSELYATVKFPKHSLRKKSPPLLLLPPVQISNVQWNKHEARSGDVLKLTADLKGVPDGIESFIEVYEHDEAGAHELISRFSALSKNRKIVAEWEFLPADDHPLPQYFFRVTVAEVGANSGLLECKEGTGP